jgi:CheY-like chemotaxis protein
LSGIPLSVVIKCSSDINAEKRRFMLRILLIEDDNSRVRQIKEWLPEDVRLVHAGSAGRAIGILQRDRNSYAGIMLDHDLQGQIATDMDFFLSGSNVVKTIMEYVPPDTPVLVHSMNLGEAPRMVTALSRSGFSVTRLPMIVMTQESLIEWLEEVRESWADRI